MSGSPARRLSDRFWSGHAVRGGESRSLDVGMAGESRSLDGRRLLAAAANVPWRHTAHAVSWSPLGTGIVLLVGAGAALSAAGASADPLVGLAAATLAAGALAGLNDPAAALLAAVPTSSARRRAHRLALLVPAALAGWAGLLVVARLDDGWQAGWPVGPLAALLMTGVAVATWAPAGWSVPAAVTVPLAWALVERLVSAELVGRWLTEWVLSVWIVHPWAVVACAGAATAEGWRR